MDTMNSEEARKKGMNVYHCWNENGNEWIIAESAQEAKEFCENHLSIGEVNVDLSCKIGTFYVATK